MTTTLISPSGTQSPVDDSQVGSLLALGWSYPSSSPAASTGVPSSSTGVDLGLPYYEWSQQQALAAQIAANTNAYNMGQNAIGQQNANTNVLQQVGALYQNSLNNPANWVKYEDVMTGSSAGGYPAYLASLGGKAGPFGYVHVDPSTPLQPNTVDSMFPGGTTNTTQVGASTDTTGAGTTGVGTSAGGISSNSDIAWKQKRAAAGISADQSNPEIDRYFKSSSYTPAMGASLKAFVDANPTNASGFYGNRDSEGNPLVGAPVLNMTANADGTYSWNYASATSQTPGAVPTPGGAAWTGTAGDVKGGPSVGITSPYPSDQGSSQGGSSQGGGSHSSSDSKNPEPGPSDTGRGSPDVSSPGGGGSDATPKATDSGPTQATGVAGGDTGSNAGKGSTENQTGSPTPYALGGMRLVTRPTHAVVGGRPAILGEQGRDELLANGPGAGAVFPLQNPNVGVSPYVASLANALARHAGHAAVHHALYHPQPGAVPGALNASPGVQPISAPWLRHLPMNPLPGPPPPGLGMAAPQPPAGFAPVHMDEGGMLFGGSSSSGGAAVSPGASVTSANQPWTEGGTDYTNAAGQVQRPSATNPGQYDIVPAYTLGGPLDPLSQNPDNMALVQKNQDLLAMTNAQLGGQGQSPNTWWAAYANSLPWMNQAPRSAAYTLGRF